MTAAGFVMAMTAPLELIFARRLGATPAALALYIAVPAGGMLAVDLLGTRSIPRRPARRVLMIGVLLFGAGVAALGAAPTVAALMVGRALEGFGGGLLLGAALQAALRVEPDQGRALGSFNGSFLLGSALGAPAGGLVASLAPGTAGFRLAFGVCAAICVAVALALHLALPLLPADPDAGDAEIGLPKLGGPPGMGPAMVLGVLGDLLRGGVVYTLLPLAGQSRHFSTITIGVAVGLLSLAEITALRASVRVIARFSVAGCLLATLSLGVVTAIALALFSGVWAYLAGALIFGVALAGATLAPALMIVALNDHDPSAGVANYRMASDLGMLVGSTGVGTAVAAVGASGVFVAVAALMSCGVVLAHRLRRRFEAPPAA